MSRAGLVPVLRATVGRCRREGSVLAWVDVGDLEALLDDADALTTLRDAWNAHFAYCLSPMPGGVTLGQIEEWKNAPSNTASGPEYALSINRLEFAGHGVKPSMTGREIRQLPNPPIPDDHDLFLVVPGHEDELVPDDRLIDVSAYGHSSGRASLRLFTAPKWITAGSSS